MLLFPSVCLYPPQYASLASASFYAHGYLYLYLYVHGHCHEQVCIERACATHVQEQKCKFVTSIYKSATSISCQWS